jgi:hypothetical protein
MMPSALEIVTRAMKIAGALGQNETPSSSEASDGLISLNDMLSSWDTDETYIFTIDSDVFNLTTGVTTYTIGTGGDFNTDRPVIFDSVVANLNGISYPLKQLNAQDYADIAYKANSTGIPEFYYCDFAFPLATIYLYGAPSSGLTLTIGKTQRLTQFADLTTQYQFPPGYNRLLNYGLAMEIAPDYGMTLTPEAQFIASESKANVRNRNLPEPVMKTEVGNLTGVYGYSNGGNY